LQNGKAHGNCPHLNSRTNIKRDSYTGEEFRTSQTNGFDLSMKKKQLIKEGMKKKYILGNELITKFLSNSSIRTA
jgi:hypothetical protein